MSGWRLLKAFLVVELVRLRASSWRDNAIQWLYEEEFTQPASADQPDILTATRERRSRHWRMAAEIAGEKSVAQAMRRFLVHEAAFGWHVSRYAAPMAPHPVNDLYSSFRWKLREDRLAERIMPNMWAWHRGGISVEGEVMDELGWNEGSAPQPVEVPVVTVPPKVVERLCRIVGDHLRRQMGGFSRGAPYRLDEIPAEDWLEERRAQRNHLLEVAGEFLGRVASQDDIVELVREGRAGELDWWHRNWPCGHPTRGACVLVPFLDVNLRTQGYVPKHPYRQRELVGPEGDLVDVVQLALTAGGAVTERDPDEDARRLAAESLAGGDATGWFERLYAEAESGEAIVPWASRKPHPLLVEWADGLRGDGRRAMVVGCGLGDDAEYVAGLGFATVAFDVSESAVRGAKERFPGSAVDYTTADLLDLPGEWRRAFDLVVEIMTVQALPEELHPAATAAVRELVAPGGTLLVIAVARDEGGEVFAPPWPLTPSEIAAFGEGGLTAEIESLPPRWRATFRRT